MSRFTLYLAILISHYAYSESLYSSSDISSYYGQNLQKVNGISCIEYEAKLSMFCTDAKFYINQKLTNMFFNYQKGDYIGRINIPTTVINSNTDFRYGHYDNVVSNGNITIFNGNSRIIDFDIPHGFSIDIDSNVTGDGTIRQHNIISSFDNDYDVDMSATASIRANIFLTFLTELYIKDDETHLLVVEPKIRVYPSTFKIDNLKTDVDASITSIVTAFTGIMYDQYKLKNTGLANIVTSAIKIDADKGLYFDYSDLLKPLIQVFNSALTPLLVTFDDLSGSSLPKILLSRFIAANTDHDLDGRDDRPFKTIEDDLNEALQHSLNTDANGLIFFEIENEDEEWNKRITAALGQI